MSYGVYDFHEKQIYCFSDLEGRIPTITDGASKNVSNVTRILKIINDKKLNNNTEAIVFTGDLIDRGPDNIKLIQNMIALKESAPENVLLCIGNRDLNKIRLVDEYFIVNNDGTSSPCFNDKNINNFKQLCTNVATNFNNKYKFKYAFTELAGPLLNTMQAGWTGFKNDKDLENIFAAGLKERVIAVEERTLGRFLHKQYAIEEFNGLFGSITFNSDDVTNGVLHAAIAIMSMVMGCIWSPSELPEYLQLYNGLYIKYLEKCHVIGVFKAGKTKYGVASHAGLPSNGDGFLLTDKLMTLADNTDNTDFFDAIRAIEQEKNDIVNLFISSSLSAPFRNNDGVTKLIHLSICGVPDNIGYTSALSPVTYMSKLSADGPKALSNRKLLTPTTLKGGMRKHVGGVKKVKFEQTNMTFYNIFGHQPAGYVPEVSIVYMNNDGQVRNVCLDISKAESIGDANKTSMAVLVLNYENDTMEGIVDTKDIIYNKGVYTYSKSFLQYNDEQNTASPGYYCNVNSYKNNKCTMQSLYGKVKLDSVDKKKMMYTFYIPDKFLKIAQFMDPGFPLPAFKLIQNNKDKLIISSGDISGIDGFMSVALYARTGADLMFIMNLLKPYNNEIINSGRQAYGLDFDYKKGKARDATKLVKLFKQLVNDIWNENKIDEKQKMYYVYNNSSIVFNNNIFNYNDNDNYDETKYFYNDINPFSQDVEPVEPAEEAMLVVALSAATSSKPTTSTGSSLQDYTSIYMDMNGPCSFYDGTNGISQFIHKNLKNIKGFYIMGGVHTLELVKVIVNPNKINRVSIATMNQAYAPSKAGNLMELLKDKLHIVSNNEVVKHGTYPKLDFFNRYYEYFGTTIDKMMIQFFSGMNEVKLFDVMNSLVLIKAMCNEASVKTNSASNSSVKTNSVSNSSVKTNSASNSQEIYSYKVKTYTFGSPESTTWSVLTLENTLGFNNLNNIKEDIYTNMYYDPVYGTTLLLTDDESKLLILNDKMSFLTSLKTEYKKEANPYTGIITSIYGVGQTGGKNGKKGSYSSLTLKELQLIAKKRGVVYSRLNKKELIDNLKKNEEVNILK